MPVKARGIVKALDEQNRVVIPKDLRKALEFRRFQTVEIILDGNGDIIVRRFEPGCHFCGRAGDFNKHFGKLVCCECREKLAKTLE